MQVPYNPGLPYIWVYNPGVDIAKTENLSFSLLKTVYMVEDKINHVGAMNISYFHNFCVCWNTGLNKYTRSNLYPELNYAHSLI